MMAERLDVEWISETLHERNLLDVMDVALDHIDEPLADPSFLPTFLLSRLAARHVKVVVGGDGGDELWGGYPTYRAHRLRRGLRARPRLDPQRTSSSAPSAGCRIDDRYQSLEWKLRRFTQRWDDDMVTRHLRWMSSVDLPDLARAIPGAKGMRPATLTAPLPETDDCAAAHPGARLLDLHAGLGADQGRSRVDGARPGGPPAAARRRADGPGVLAAVALQGARAASGKYLLKLAARGKIPDEIIDRPKKGFGIPLATWLRGPLRDRIERGRRAVAGLRSRHPRRRRVPRAGTDDHQDKRGRSEQAAVGAARAGSLVPAHLDRSPAATSRTAMADDADQKTAQGSPDRFGYEWSTYSAILPESRGQLERWLGPTDARQLPRQERDGRRLRHGPQPVLVRRGRRAHRCWASTWTTAAWRPRARTWRRSPTRASRRRSAHDLDPHGARHLRSRHLHRRAAPPGRARERAAADVELRRARAAIWSCGATRRKATG